jgi:hypothetical protein
MAHISFMILATNSLYCCSLISFLSNNSLACFRRCSALLGTAVVVWAGVPVTEAGAGAGAGAGAAAVAGKGKGKSRGPSPAKLQNPLMGAGMADFPGGFPDLSQMPPGLNELPPGLAGIDLSKLKFPGQR